MARRDELDRVVAAWTQTRDAVEIMRALQANGIPAAAVYNMLDVLADPHLAARRQWQMIDRAYVGRQPNPVAPYRVGETPHTIETPAPTLGQHNRRVLGELLGLTDDDLERLTRAGVIGQRPVMPREPLIGSRFRRGVRLHQVLARSRA